MLLPVWAFALSFGAPADRFGRLRRELIGIVVLVAVSTAWKAFVLGSGFADGRVGQLKLSLPWWLDVFALGMLCAVVSVAIAELGIRTPLGLDRKWAPAVTWTLAAGAFWFVAAGIGLPHTTPEIPLHLLWGQHYLYALTAVLLVLPAVFGPVSSSVSRIRRFLANRAVVYVGLVSYGIYLWHEFWIDQYLEWTNQPVFTVYNGDVPFAWHTSMFFSAPWTILVLAVFGLTLVTSTVSWFLFERPILLLKRFGPGAPR